jgi:hypothetical protein
MIVVPYSALPNWEPPLFAHPADLRQKAVSYLKRLYSAYFEYLNIRADLRVDADSTKPDGKAQYFHDHGLRTENVDAVGDQILDEIKGVEDLIATLGGKDCASVISTAQSNPKDRDAARTQQDKQKATCRNHINAALARDNKVVIDFDDYKYWIRFPLPNNALPDVAKEILLNTTEYDPDNRTYLYAMWLYKHWVERISDYRCRLFFQCMKQSERGEKMDMILASFQEKVYARSEGKDAFAVHSIEVPATFQRSTGAPTINLGDLKKTAMKEQGGRQLTGKVGEVVKQYGLYVN